MTEEIPNADKGLRKTLAKIYSAVGKKAGDLHTWLGKHRWLSAAIIILIGIAIGEWMEARYAFLDFRYKGYQVTQSWAARLKDDLYDHHTVLVLVGDQEYWAGNYEGRSPINKTHLGELVTALDQYQPKVVALDFYFSSPKPDGSILEHDKFKKETADLAKALRELKSKPKIILPKTLGIEDGFYRADSAVYDQSDVGGAQFGYIDLPGDYRMIPPSLPLKDGQRLDSFSEAIVRAFDLTGKALQWDRNDEQECFASGLLSEAQLSSYSATDVLHPDEATRAELAHEAKGNIVIIGGAWSKDAFGRGTRVDTRYTPVGSVPAVFLHAAWVESMLASRTARPMRTLPKWLLELFLGFLTYKMFTHAFFVDRRFSRWINYSIRLAYLIVMVCFWLFVAYVTSQNFGVFFDPVIPTLASLGKAAYEQIDDWRVAANRLEKFEKLHGPLPA